METISVELIDSQAIILLKELEKKKIIKLPNSDKKEALDFHKYKGILKSGTKEETDHELAELRNSWQ